MFGELALWAQPAHANNFATSQRCAGCSLIFEVDGVHTTQAYHVDWKIDGSISPVTGTIAFTPQNPPCLRELAI
jgi:hypothetical protein